MNELKCTLGRGRSELIAIIFYKQRAGALYFVPHLSFLSIAYVVSQACVAPPGRALSQAEGCARRGGG